MDTGFFFHSVAPFVHQFNAISLFALAIIFMESWTEFGTINTESINYTFYCTNVGAIVSVYEYTHTTSSTTTKSTRLCFPSGHSTQLHSTFMCFDIVLLPKYTDQHTHVRCRGTRGNGIHIIPLWILNFRIVVLVNLWKLRYNWILSFRENVFAVRISSAQYLLLNISPLRRSYSNRLSALLVDSGYFEHKLRTATEELRARGSGRFYL